MPEPSQAPAVSRLDESGMTRIYVAVVFVEALVILALWAFSRYFA
jgi:hypothetical protein